MSTTAIQEALLCPFFLEDTLYVALVLRRGRDCLLLTTLTGLPAAVSTSRPGTETVSAQLRLPCRVIDGQEGALLARKTLLAEADGRSFHRL